MARNRFRSGSLLTVLLILPLFLTEARRNLLIRPTPAAEDGSAGTKWAVLIAGSSGYENYRHQADICHAYQIMKRGGLKDENIIVFMYDDIAHNVENPRPGIIVNHPLGGDVYAGVPKDYTGENVNANNVLAVILGNKSAISGGSGKVVASGPNDHVFIYYSDHGGPGVLSMPTNPDLYANDFIAALKKKHASRSYKSMVIYIEACESGSIFEGLLPTDINIYATTASKADENSWGTYCYSHSPSRSPDYKTCLGDLYSVSWMEDSDRHNPTTETFEEQYEHVKEKTSVNGTYKEGSHVMQYGDLDLSKEYMSTFMGSHQASENSMSDEASTMSSLSNVMKQRDADLFHYWNKFLKSPEGSTKRDNARKDLVDIITHRSHVDHSMSLISKLLFGSEKGLQPLTRTRPEGQPLVDDWDCLKSMIRTFETHCGSLSQYGMKYTRFLANICNDGIKTETMAKVSVKVCPHLPSNPWSSLHKGFSA